ncbi:MAG: ArsR family transcriptional regulator [Halobacteriota archaeon]|nr:ArsR family transcriptional regulator [Halobacteriota archaeon]
MNNEDLAKRKEEWIKKIKKEGKLKNPTEDHKLGLKALQHKTRRDILDFIGYDVKKEDEIRKEFELDDLQLKIHLPMLEQALFVEKEGDFYRLTPRGLSYMENVEWR